MLITLALKVELLMKSADGTKLGGIIRTASGELKALCDWSDGGEVKNRRVQSHTLGTCCSESNGNLS